jgi:hypothetical protein
MRAHQNVFGSGFIDLRRGKFVRKHAEMLFFATDLNRGDPFVCGLLPAHTFESAVCVFPFALIAILF